MNKRPEPDHTATAGRNDRNLKVARILRPVSNDDLPNHTNGKFHASGKLDEEDFNENESILRVMSQHAEHRGPRAIDAVGDNLAVRYFRSRSWRSEQNLAGGAVTAGVTPQNVTVTDQRRAQVLSPLGADYICHMCGEKGHHIKLCPKRQGKRQAKKVRAATGIPRSWLQLIDSTQANEYDNVYCLPNGRLAVLRSDTAKSLPRELSGKPALASEDLKCTLCDTLFNEATLVSCCGSTFCRACLIPLAKVPNEGYCPACGYFPFGLVDFEPNTAVQDSVLDLKPIGAANLGEAGQIKSTVSGVKEELKELVTSLTGVTEATSIVKDIKLESSNRASDEAPPPPSISAAKVSPSRGQGQVVATTGYAPPFSFGAGKVGDDKCIGLKLRDESRCPPTTAVSSVDKCGICDNNGDASLGVRNNGTRNGASVLSPSTEGMQPQQTEGSVVDQNPAPSDSSSIRPPGS